MFLNDDCFGYHEIFIYMSILHILTCFMDNTLFFFYFFFWKHSIYDYDMLDSDDFLGGVSIPLLALQAASGNESTTTSSSQNQNQKMFVEGWFPLTKDEHVLFEGTSISTAAAAAAASLPVAEKTSGGNSGGSTTGHGEVYIRARVTTTTLSTFVSSIVPIAIPVDRFPALKFNVDVLCENFFYFNFFY